MIRIIFITVLFLSSNVFAATYLVCSGYDILSAKLNNKTVSIKYKTNDYVDYTQNITEWNNEIIKMKYETSENQPSFRKLTKEEERECDNCRLKSSGVVCYAQCIKLGPSKLVSVSKNITIDRVTGILSWDGDVFQCEVKKKTLF